MDQTDAAFWQEVCHLLENSECLEQEYRTTSVHKRAYEHEGLDIQMSKLRRGIVHMIDSYADEFIDKQEFELRVTRMRERMQHLEAQVQSLKGEVALEGELHLILG